MNLGYSLDELMKMSAMDIKRSYTLERFSLLATEPGQLNVAFETTHRRKDGTEYPVAVHLERTVQEDIPVFVAVIQNITARKLAEQTLLAAHLELEQRVSTRTEELLAEKVRAEVTLRSIGDGVITTDALGKVEFINPVAEDMTGWLLADAKGQPIETVFHILNEDDRTPLESPMIRCLAQGAVVRLGDHTVLVGRLGKEYFIQDSAAPSWGPQHQLVGAVLVFSDVSERYRLAPVATHNASHDALTELVNRREFELRVQRSLDAAHRDGDTHALVYLDLDQFKVINDTGGHVAGDELLRQLSRLLDAQIRGRDTFARLGGDEFGLLMEHCALEQAHLIADKLLASISNYRFVWEKHTFRVGASLGLVAIDSSSATIAELLRRADATCYAAKDAGRNRVHVYRDDDLALSARHGAMLWVARIQQALDHNRFRLYWQPIVPLGQTASGREDIRFEVLLRLEDEDGSIILPGAFLPAAERYDLATEIDRWVVRHTLAALASRPALVQRLASCAINLSGQSLGHADLVDFIEAELKKSGVPPHKICFEVTETAAIASFGAATAIFERLQKLGCRFALDDFGAGLSSFTYLKRLPVDVLKIDGSFVTGMADDPIDYAMVKSINELGHVMGKTTIA
jgi:diguanylate cyclase (GGDEF)-like protein/PAS domain S-box-containing protein